MPPFTDPSLFPKFYTLPTTTDEVDDTRKWHLIAQVKNNMTITKPTLIVMDRSGTDFAVVFEDTAMDLKARGLKKGNTIVIPQARRLEKGESKKDVLVVEREDCASVKAISGKLHKVLELGNNLEDEGRLEKCATCGEAESNLLKCTGCRSVAYCSKDCQIKGWEGMGHKSDCKLYKAIREIWCSPEIDTNA